MEKELKNTKRTLELVVEMMDTGIEHLKVSVKTINQQIELAKINRTTQVKTLKEIKKLLM